MSSSWDELLSPKLSNVLKTQTRLNKSVLVVDMIIFSFTFFGKNISIFNKVWSEELGDVTEDWLVENLQRKKNKMCQ